MGQTILIVDDEPGIREYAQEVLERIKMPACDKAQR